MKDIKTQIELLKLLADGECHSGEQLGVKLCMSRAAINKHINTIKKWGVELSSSPGKGYQLKVPFQFLNEKLIKEFVPENQIFIFPVIDSTNQYLLNLLHSLSSGDTCIAEYQSAGRGRRGRRWFSPFGVNMYMSMYWRLDQGPGAAIGLSLVIGVVVAEVLQKLGALDVKVKWPNDIYLYDRKLAGILVELTGRTGDAAHIVIGLGINIQMNSVDESIVNQDWISLQEAGISIDRNQLSIMLINALHDSLSLFERNGLEPFLERWKKLDNYLDRTVQLLIGDSVVSGICRGIDSTGELILEHDNKIAKYIGGEISLRGK